MRPTLTVTYTAFPAILLSKTWAPNSDPVNGFFNPKSVPGASALCTIIASNQGYGTAETNSVVFGNDYVPVADANGVDPNVTHLRVNPAGPLNASDGTNHPVFVLAFRVRLN